MTHQHVSLSMDLRPKEALPLDRIDRMASPECLYARASTLLSEFREFNDYLQRHNQQHDVEMRIYRRGLEAEFEKLHAIVSRKQRADSLTNTLTENLAEVKAAYLMKTSNIPHYEVWWSIAKSRQGIRGLGRRLPLSMSDTRDGRGRRKREQKRGEEVQVDIIAADGLEWIKVSSVSEKRLLFEMAKEGWERYEESSNDSETANSSPTRSRRSSENEGHKLELLRLAESLRTASKGVRVRYKHPQIRLILPRITKGIHSDIDALLADISATGAVIECGTPHEFLPVGSSAACDDLNATFRRMAPSTHHPSLTPTLNIDCSILIALISDQCHMPPSKLPSRPMNTSRAYHHAILQQMAHEEAHPILQTELYPLFRNRLLTCTAEAAARTREIVGTMGTPTERRRAELILGDASRAESRTSLQELSEHPIPSDILLPIQIVPVDVPALTAGVPLPQHPAFPFTVAHRLARHTRLSDLNASVLLYGWAEDVVTVTSNSVAARQVEKGLGEVLDWFESHGEEVEQDGPFFREPTIWVVESSRSLVGKEKQGQGGSSSSREKRREEQEDGGTGGSEVSIVEMTEQQS